MRLAGTAFAGLLVVSAACGAPETGLDAGLDAAVGRDATTDEARGTVEGTLTLTQSTAWNPGAIPLGGVQAVAEAPGVLAVFGDAGLVVLGGVTLTGRDARVRDWRSAGVIAAADGRGTWVVGVGTDGVVRRVAPGVRLEDVSERFGLGADAVRASLALDDRRTGFALERGWAVTDGTRVWRDDRPAATAWAAGQGRFALAAADEVLLLDPAAPSTTRFPLRGVVSLAFDPRGVLFAATASTLHQLGTDGALHPVLASARASFGAMTADADGVWILDGGELVQWADGLARRSHGLGFASDARLFPATAGGFWVLSGGALQRWVRAADDTQRATWERDVAPVFLRACAACHVPGGSAPNDLSSFEAWRAQRARIRLRVVEQRNMPPAGSVLRDEDRAVLDNYTRPTDGGA